MDAIQQEQTTPANERRRALMIATLASVLLYVLWNTSAAAMIAAPLRLFVTYIHEAGHSLGAILTGGRAIGFLVSPDGSGLATTAGGNRMVVISGGYLGAALFGSLLFYLANRFSRFDRFIAIALGLFMIGFTLRFARPDESGALTAIYIGLSFGAALVAIGWWAPRTITLLVLDMLAISTALNAVLDVWYLVNFIDASRGMVRNDAVAYSQEVTGGIVPATLVSLSWVGIAIVMFGMSVWYGVWKPLQEEVDVAYSKLRGRSE
ncbi:MAG: M50 family metallopeptidase [Chloroflexota bacterium]